jgi:sulfopropanediol 3-dehydrogenase
VETTLKDGRDHGTHASEEVRATVARIVDAVRQEGAAGVRRLSAELDGWSPERFALGRAEAEALAATVAPALREHVDRAARRIRAFAEAQLGTLTDLDVELEPGLFAGHRLVPVASVGAYVPGGRYPLISSALMSVVTARVAGVDRVVVATPPQADGRPFAATVYAALVAGADEIYVVGGAHALAGLAFGALDDLDPVDMIVGAGNAYVAEAKRQLYGEVGIDLLAGPTEILVLADASADPHTVAVDLLSQAEHGPGSPAVLATTSRAVGEAVLAAANELLPAWPTRAVTEAAWEEFGRIVLVDSEEELIAFSDAFAAEHLELHVADPAALLPRLRNYGGAFVGDGTTVTFGDKGAGPNHTLPTQRTARYTGGLWVGSYLKTITHQRVEPGEGAQELAADAVAISEAEGLLGHARAAAARLSPPA